MVRCFAKVNAKLTITNRVHPFLPLEEVWLADTTAAEPVCAAIPASYASCTLEKQQQQQSANILDQSLPLVRAWLRNDSRSLQFAVLFDSGIVQWVDPEDPRLCPQGCCAANQQVATPRQSTPVQPSAAE